jgi:Cd2+/Zn2+-exporting ATPase
MEKIKINLGIVLPDVPDEKDECVQRIISLIQNNKGVDKVHIIPKTENTKAQLCFHYNPEIISIEAIQKMAEKAGAAITEKYEHLLIEVRGIRHASHTRIIESGLKDLNGVLSASVSAIGWISIEYGQEETSTQKIDKHLKKSGLQVITEPAHDHAEEK